MLKNDYQLWGLFALVALTGDITNANCEQLTWL